VLVELEAVLAVNITVMMLSHIVLDLKVHSATVEDTARVQKNVLGATMVSMPMDHIVVVSYFCSKLSRY
jgi:uncharacterized protein (UPF0212 family)